jgi:hypothetical protein
LASKKNRLLIRWLQKKVRAAALLNRCSGFIFVEIDRQPKQAANFAEIFGFSVLKSGDKL